MARVLNPLTHRKILKNGIPGQAAIVAMGVMDRNTSTANLPMTLQVYVEGRTPYEVEDQWIVRSKNVIGLSGRIPVRVGADDSRGIQVPGGIDIQSIDLSALVQQAGAMARARPAC
jgi:hypothetical protein